MSSVTTLFSRCNLTARKSGVLQLSARAAGIASLNVTVSNCVVAVYQSSGGLLLVNGTSGTEAVRYIAIINSAVTVDTQPPVITFVSGDAISAVRGTKMLTVVVLGGVWTWPGDAGPAIVFDVDGRMGGGGAWGLSSLSVTNVVFVVDLGGSDVVRPTMSVVEFRGGLTGTLFSHGSIALSNISLATTQATTTPTILPPAIVSFLVISGAAVFVGVDIRVVACRAPLWNLVGNVRTAICVQSSDSAAPNITNSTMTVQDGLGGLPSNVTAVAVDTNVSATGGGMSLIHSCTIIVRCMDMATTGVSVVEMSGTVVNSTIRVELVAIHQAENNDVALVRLQSATSTSSSSTENRVQIVHSNVKVPALIFSSTGAAAFADGGSVLQCSYVGTMPLNAGLLDQFLAAKVSTELSMCASTKRSVMPSDLVFDLEAAQCWSTLTPSVSASTLASFTESHSEIRSATVSRRTPSTTTSLAASTTRTSSPTLSISRTWSKSTVVTMSFSWSSSSSNTTSLSRSTTLSGASRTATPSRTVTLSTSATHSLLQTPSNSTTWSPSMTHIATATQGSATQSSATLLPSSSASLKFCECTGSLIEALNVFLAAPERTSSTSSAMVTMLTPAAANGTSLLAAPLSRLALWTSGSINASLSVRRLWSVDHSGNIETDGVETLCWAPAGASVRGVSMSTGATMLPTSSAATDDTVTWVLEVNSVGADNETIEWVPTTVGAYQDTTIRLGVSFVCSAGSPLAPGGVRLSTRSVTMIIPVTKMPQQLAAEVRSSSQVLQFASIMSGAGGSAGRVMATRAVVLCSSDVNSATVSAGPLGLELWSDACDDAGSAISVYRGTIIGNVVLLAVVCAAVLGMALYVSRSSRVPFVGGLRRVAFPSSLMPVWVVVLPSTGTATMQVIALSSGCAGADVVCAVVGITLVAAPPIALMWLAWWIPSHASVNAIRSASAPAARITLRQQSMWIVRSILRPMWKWSALKPAAVKAEDDESNTRSSADASLRHSVVVVQDYRHVWYAALDTAMLVVVGALVAVSGHGTTQQCIAAGVLVTAAYALQLVVCAALRPFTTIFGGGYALFSLTFTLLGAVLQMSMFAVSGNASTASLLSRLGLAASVCDLMVLGSSFVRTLVDVHDLTREVFVLLGCAAAANAVPVDPRGDLDAKGIAVTWLSLPGAKAFDDESMCGVLPLSPMEMFLLEEHQEAPDGTEHLFWDAEGNAIGLEGESLHRGSSLINVGHDNVNASYL